MAPLLFACKNGHLKVIELLLQKGAKADKSDLEACMELKHELIVKVVSKLLKSNPEVKGWHDAMLKACEMGYPELVEVLLQYEKWDMPHRDCEFQYGQHQVLLSCYGKALHHAACSGEIKVLKLLLNSKQSAEVTPKVMMSLVYDACESDSPEMVKFLLTHEKLSGTESDAVKHIFRNRSASYTEEYALMKATRKGHDRVVQQLLECGAIIDLQNNTGKSALMVAVRERQSKTAKILIDKGATADLQDSGENTALSKAISVGFLEGVELLLENNASIVGTFYEPSLHRTIEQKDKIMVKLLLEKGAPVNSRDHYRKTALMKACDQPELIKLLLDNGADAKLFDSNGEYALLHLVKKVHQDQNIWTQLNFYWKRKQMPPQFQIGGCQPKLS